MGHLVSGPRPQRRWTMTTATTDAGGVGPGRGGRMSRPRKREAVLRLLRGEDLETVSRALGGTAATLAGWRGAFLAGGEAPLATKPADARDLEVDRLRAKLGETVLERELLAEKVAALEAGPPLARRRWRGGGGRPHHRSAGRTSSPWSVASGASPARPSTAIASRPARPPRGGRGRPGRGRTACRPPGGAGGRSCRCRTRSSWRRSGRCWRPARSTARATARCGRDCATAAS